MKFGKILIFTQKNYEYGTTYLEKHVLKVLRSSDQNLAENDSDSSEPVPECNSKVDFKIEGIEKVPKRLNDENQVKQQSKMKFL